MLEIAPVVAPSVTRVEQTGHFAVDIRRGAEPKRDRR